MATATQKQICEALGFEAPNSFAGWTPGAFGRIWVINLPYIPAVNSVLKSLGFRWEDWRKAWSGSDDSVERVEALQALSFCSGRNYIPDASPIGDAPSFSVEAYPGATHRMCPVRVGTFDFE